MTMDTDHSVTSQRTCMNCGRFVTEAFARVFGDNDDRVAGCPECESTRNLTAGVAADTAREQAGPR